MDALANLKSLTEERSARSRIRLSIVPDGLVSLSTKGARRGELDRASEPLGERFGRGHLGT